MVVLCALPFCSQVSSPMTMNKELPWTMGSVSFQDLLAIYPENSQARWSETTPCNTVKLRSAKAKHASAHALRRSMWKVVNCQSNTSNIFIYVFFTDGTAHCLDICVLDGTEIVFDVRWHVLTFCCLLGEIIFNDRLISLFFQIISKCRKAGSFGVCCLWAQHNVSITFAVQKSVYLLVLTYVWQIMWTLLNYKWLDPLSIISNSCFKLYSWDVNSNWMFV